MIGAFVCSVAPSGTHIASSTRAGGPASGFELAAGRKEVKRNEKSSESNDSGGKAMPADVVAARGWNSVLTAADGEAAAGERAGTGLHGIARGTACMAEIERCRATVAMREAKQSMSTVVSCASRYRGSKRTPLSSFRRPSPPPFHPLSSCARALPLLDVHEWSDIRQQAPLLEAKQHNTTQRHCRHGRTHRHIGHHRSVADN